MQITLQLPLHVAHHLHRQGPSTSESEELDRITTQFGVELTPIHPGTADPDLIRYFTMDVPDQFAAEQLIAHLQQSSAVEAAYVKPPDAMP